jgi:uncharacterized membrane protein (UPF0136 family)
MNPFAVQVVLCAYGVLLAVGGVIGFLKARSRPSLVAGLASAALALLFAWAAGTNLKLGSVQGGLLAVVLATLFAVRFRKSRRWMPAGMMMVASLVVALFLLLTGAFAHSP